MVFTELIRLFFTDWISEVEPCPKIKYLLTEGCSLSEKGSIFTISEECSTFNLFGIIEFSCGKSPPKNPYEFPTRTDEKSIIDKNTAIILFMFESYCVNYIIALFVFGNIIVFLQILQSVKLL